MNYQLSTNKQIRLETYTEQPCAVKVFELDNMKIYISDFGTIDLYIDETRSYCKKCNFVPYDITSMKAHHTMVKLKLTESEYLEIVNLITTKFTFGECTWCQSIGVAI